MLRRSLGRVRRSATSPPPRRSPHEDDEVDALYDQVYRELLMFMLANPRTIDQATLCCGSRTTWSASPTA